MFWAGGKQEEEEEEEGGRGHQAKYVFFFLSFFFALPFFSPCTGTLTLKKRLPVLSHTSHTRHTTPATTQPFRCRGVVSLLSHRRRRFLTQPRHFNGWISFSTTALQPLQKNKRTSERTNWTSGGPYRECTCPRFN